MISCHECGSDVAENTEFCPFCGISLQPAAVVAGDVDESLESTIMMPPSEIAKLVKDAGLASRDSASTEAAEDSLVDEAPVPQILRELSKTSDNIIPSATSEIEVGDVEEEKQIQASSAETPTDSVQSEKIAKIDDTVLSEEIAESSELAAIEETPDIETEVAEPSWDDTEFAENVEELSMEPEEVASDAEPAISVESLETPISTLAASEVPTEETEGEIEMPESAPTAKEFTDSIAENILVDNESLDSAPAISDVSENPRTGIDESTDQPETEAEIFGAETSKPGEPQIEESLEAASAMEVKPDFAAPASDAVISMPDDELVSPDSFSSKPMFDSVRIMENDPRYSQDYVETQLGIPVSKSEDKKEISEPFAVSGLAPEPENVPISQTTPGIGKVDTDGRSSSKLKPLTEGTVLNGRYEIIRKIGGGGMGAVYLASDNNLGGVLRAVKEMVQTHIEESQQDKAIKDFKRESMILSTLDHPSIPTIFDYFYDESECRFYLVMKYISGGDLSARLRSAPEGKLDELTVTDWAVQIADVLDYLHNHPSTIVYRDLKPSNIMIDGNSSRVMLIDFGIARSIGQQQERGVTAVGTMGYAPPELFSGNVEPRSDIYSLGSTIFHLLTGADPQSNPLLIFDFQKNPRPRQINPQISDQMEQILMRSVEYSADARFESSAALRSVLTEHLSALKNGRTTYGVIQSPIPIGLANQSAFCGFCGQKIIASDLFCAFCGSRQPIAQPGVATPVRAALARTAKVLIEGTSELDTPVFALQKDQNLVGRRDPMSNIFPEIDLSKYDPQTKISRRHARIWRDGNDYLVEDLGSSNGTLLGKSPETGVRLVPHQPQVLSNGDKLKIGDTTLHFVVG